MKRVTLILVPLLIGALCLGSCRRRPQRDRSEAPTEQTADSATTAQAPQTQAQTFKPLNFKLYIERSGSMVAFDSNASSGDFKRTVTDMLNNIPSLNNDSSSLFIVNDDIYPVPMSIRDFIQERDWFGRTASMGNPGYTDFARIFDLMMNRLAQDQVSILFSDLIYSVKGQQDFNAAKLCNEANALTNNIFRSHRNIDVTVAKFMGDYRGSYYPYNSPNQGKAYSGRRPYYAMIFANHESENTLRADPKYKAFLDFDALQGFCEGDQFTFTAQKFNPDFEIVGYGEGRQGSYRLSTDKKGIFDAEKKKSNFKFPVAIDLSAVPMPDSLKRVPSNYVVTSAGNFEIESITPTNKHGKATHVMLLSGNPINCTVGIRMLYKLPEWIDKSTSIDDSDMQSADFASTTFAFKDMMEGIYQAYIPDESQAYLFEINIPIKR